ncbi:MAG TPA: hypothetical protein VFJ97_04005 [Dermatophilaceae bacterium]|nr:hypothetical protein [Dermatophilaceae bacterium]
MQDVSAALAQLPTVFTAKQARDLGVSRHVLARAARRQLITLQRRGVYAVTRPDATDRGWQQVRRGYLERARVAVLAHPGHAVSHETAAVAHGLPVLLHPQSRVHLTGVRVEPRSRRLDGTVLHHCDSLDNEVVNLAGLTALTAARTVADCLRTMYPAKAVAVADAGARAGVASLEEVRAILSGQRRWVGRPRALAALELVDPRRETWVESYSFVELLQHGLPLPVPQVEIFDAWGRFVARSDGMWILEATVAEVDGAGKYGLPLRLDGLQEAAVVSRVLAEKAREDDIRGLGLEVVRWSSTDIRYHPEQVALRAAAARRRGRLERFTGRLRVGGCWVDVPALLRDPTGHRLGREIGPQGPDFAA